MNILKELKKLRKLLENKNYGDQLAVWELVDILIKFFGQKKEADDKKH